MMNKPKLLLHICCAPCVFYVWQKLSCDFSLTGFFFNPNIHPLREYEFRRLELEKIALMYKWDIIYPPYSIEEWFQEIKGMEKEPERGKRCTLCFRFRLQRVFAYAKKNGYDWVATTLSISPYKNTHQINTEGQNLSQELGVFFLVEDFKRNNGYQKANELARAAGIKHQEYCGCVFSKVERILKKKGKNI